MRRFAATATAGVIATVAAVAAAAAPTWQPAVDLSPAGYAAASPQIELTAGGDAVAAWTRGVEPHRPGPIGTPTPPVVVQTATRPRGGSWSRPLELSRPAGDIVPLRLVLADSGIAFAAWRRFDGISTSLDAAFRRGGWTRAALVGADGQFEVAVTPAGAAALVWVGDDLVTRAAYRGQSGEWGAPVVLDGGRPHHSPRVTFDGGGNAVAVWVSRASEGWVVTAARRDAGSGVWSAPVETSAPADLILSTRIVADTTNAVHVIWKSRRGDRDTIEAASRISPVGPWEPPVELGEPSSYAVEPDIAADASGAVVAVWSESTGARMVARGAYRPAGAAWQPAEALSPSETDAFGTRVALDGGGNAVAVWRLAGRGIHASLRPRSLGVWLPPNYLGAGFAPEIALDRSGNGVALWSDGVVQAAALDASGPFLRRVTVPSRGSTRTRLAFAVKPAPWSTPLVGLPHWSFGDGSGARGTRVGHRYRRPGVYTITVRQRDAGGGTTTLTARVRIVRR